MATSNEALLSAIIRHQVNILRFSKGEAEAVVRILDEADKDLMKRIAARTSQGLSGLETARLESILADVRKQRQKAIRRIQVLMKKDLKDLAFAEAEFETDAIQAALEFDINTASVPDAKLAALANAPIRGVALDGWLENMAAADVNRLQSIISLGVIEGATNQQLRAQLVQAFGVTKRNAEALARTSVNHISNAARESVWEANSDIIDGLRWTATLDGRTSPICQSRDGEIVAFGDNEFPGEEMLDPAGARPPAHFNCRSVMTPIIDGETAIGDRPFVRSRKRPEQRLADFRASAMAKAGPKWKTMTAAQRKAAIAAERKAWAKANIGRVPGKMTYEQWLRKQPRQFQDEVLGREKGKLFRQGMSLDKFVDKSGKTLGIQALKAESKQQVLALAQPGIGIKAKALLQQGKSNQAVLNAILKEFPDANTTLASVASYKSQLKKAGQLNKQHVAGGQGTVGVGPGNIAHVMGDFMENLPEGVAAQLGNTWYQIVDDLSNGHYAHYKPGLGVQISAKKIGGVSPAQAEQILAHELGHMLHKMFPELDDFVLAGKLNKGAVLKMKNDLSPDGLKNYSYYLSKYDELVAEIYAQALSTSPITSQGILSHEFKDVFGDLIDNAKANLAKKFPKPKAAPPATGTPIPGSGLTVGNPQHLGVTGYIKELLKQNMNGDDILKAVKAEFPNAKTTKASIASTKSVMKKKGELGSPASKVVIDAPQKSPPVQPVVKDVKPKFVTAQDAANDMNILTSQGDLKSNIGFSVSQQKKYAKKVLLKLLQSGKTGPNSDLAAQIKAIFPKAGMKATNVASFKTNWKKKGLWGDEGLEAIGMVQPKLKVSQLGSHSKKGVIKAEKMFANGATHQEVIEMLDGHFAPFDPNKGADLLYLAEYNAKTKKFTGHAGAQAVHKPTPTATKPSPTIKPATDMTPLRPATNPNEAWPPPPRFTEPQRVSGLDKILGGWRSSYQKQKFTRLNASMRKQGLEELTETEFAVINMYTGGSYRTINTKMRSGQYADNLHLQALVDAGQSGLRKLQESTFRHQGLSSRGTTLSPEHYAMFQKVYVKGAVVEEFGFLSSTKGPVPAFGGRIKFMIQSRTGIFVRDFSKHPSEDEVLFMPGAKFRIDKVEINTDQRRTVVHMTEIHP